MWDVMCMNEGRRMRFNSIQYGSHIKRFIRTYQKASDDFSNESRHPHRFSNEASDVGRKEEN